MKVCEKCEMTFSTKSSLNRHLLICSKSIIPKPPPTEIKCRFCDRLFSFVQNKKRHEITCKEKPILVFIEDHNSQYMTKTDGCRIEKKIEELHEIISTSVPIVVNNTVNNTSTTTNNININLILSSEDIQRKIFRFFSDEHMCDGMKGIAEFMVKYVLTNEEGHLLYVCYDYSRQLFTYTDEQNRKIIDPKALKLIETSFPHFRQRISFIAEMINERLKYLNQRESYGLLTKTEENEKEKIMFLIDKTSEISYEISEMKNNNKFSLNMSNLTYNRNQSSLLF